MPPAVPALSTPAAMLTLLAVGCIHREPARMPAAPVVHPVDPNFTGDVQFRGASLDTYAVTGRDDTERLRSIRASPGFVSEGHAAATHWSVRWEYVDAGVCAAADIHVEAELVVRFPRWTPIEGAPVAASGNWQRYVRALAVHEQGHIDLIRAIVARMPAVLAAEGCARVDALGREALQVITEANAAYDRETQSGATQGAVLFGPSGTVQPGGDP